MSSLFDAFLRLPKDAELLHSRSMESKLTLAVLLIAIGSMASLLLREVALLPDGHLHTHILDIGQGDSILLVSPSGSQIIVDGGPDLSALERIAEYMPFFDRTIELLVLTHTDLDHIAAFPEILRRYHIERILMTGIETDQARYESALQEIFTQKTPVILADPAKDIRFSDGLTLDVVWPPSSVFGSRPKKTNNTSIVLRALFGTGSVLLTGDIERDAEMAILATGADIRSDVLKVPHHGSKTSSSTGFLLAVRPLRAVISLGRDNSYGHPHASVLDRFAFFHIPVRRTDLEKTISFSF